MKRLYALVAIGWVTFFICPFSGPAQTESEGSLFLKEADDLRTNPLSRQDLEQSIDKYQQALRIFRRTHSEKLEGTALNNIGWAYDDLDQYQKALEYYEQSLTVRRKIGDITGEGVTLNNIGVVYKSLGQYRKALEYYEQALTIRRKTGNIIGEGVTLNNIGLIYDNLGQYQKALECYEQSLNINRKLGNSKGEGISLNNIGLVHKELGQYQKALEHFEQSLLISRKIGNIRGEGIDLNNIGLVYDDLAQYQKALEYYEQSLAIDRKTGNISGEAITLNNIGAVYKALAQYQKALDYYEQSLTIRRKIGDIKGEGTTLNNIGLVYDDLAQYQKALEYYGQSLAIRRKTGNISGEGVTLNNIGAVYKALAQYQKALDYYEQSLTIRRKIGDVRGEGTTLNNIGLVYDASGQYQKALEYYEQSLPIHRKVGNIQMEGTTLGNIGATYDDLGEYRKSLDYYEQSLQISRKIGDVSGEAVTLGNIGLVYDYLGHYRKALGYFEQSLTIKRKIGDLSGEGVTLHNFGFAYKSLGQYQKALEYYEQSLNIRRKIGDIHGEGATLGNIGAIYNQMAKYDEALGSFQQVIDIYGKLGISTDGPKDDIGNLHLDRGELDKAEPFIKEAGYYSSLGRLYLLKTDYANAKDFYEKVLRNAQKSGNANNLFTAYTGLGKTNEALEDYKKSEEYYEKGMNLTEELRSSLLPSERKNFFEVKVNGFERSEPAKGLTRVRMKLNQAAGSIASSEVTRARAFSDNISLRSDAGYAGVPQQILQKEDELVLKVAALKKDLAKTDKEKDAVKYENINKSVQEAEANLKSFVEMLWEKFKPYASVKYPRPVTLKESALKPEECVVIFDVSDEGVGVKLIKGKKIAETSYKEWKFEDLEKDIKKFRQAFEEMKLKEFDPELAESLYNNLLGRILFGVPKGTPLVIIPDGILSVLPFEALVVSGKATWNEDSVRPYPDGLTYLGDLYPISYYQSITAMSLARTLGSKEKPGPKIMIIADPVFESDDPRIKASSVQERQRLLAGLPEKLMSIKSQTGVTFPRLSQTSDFADRLKKLNPGATDIFTGMQAKKTILFDKPMMTYGSIIFATHGYFGKDLPGIQEPVLAMTLLDQPKDQDGFLRMTEVMGMKLNANVVALTACQTGVGSNLSGEGVMSMGRAFQYAGAKSILMSLWSVSESGSVLLVEKFFEHLDSGKTKLEALKLAREDVREAGYKHPFYWAPFILVGETN